MGARERLRRKQFTGSQIKLGQNLLIFSKVSLSLYSPSLCQVDIKIV